MDVTTCLKSLLLAVQQYRDGRTTQNAAQLQKLVEVMSRECVRGLVELAGNPNTIPTLTSAIVSLLSQLAGDDGGLEVLNSRYNLTSTLASVVHCHSGTPEEPLVLQCLQLLQRLTYNTRVFQSTNYIQELLAFLMAAVQSHSDELLAPCLGLMVNLCRDNRSVQRHIKSLDLMKPFYRALINLLAHNSLTVVVFTLSILASLTLGEKVGEKLFDAQNIHQTFQLVFNIIVNGDGTLTRKYSVDLLVDLLKNPKIAEYLTRYQHFSACVSKVLGLLQSKDPDSAAKVLELLLAMCSVSGLRPLLCEVVFRPAAGRSRRGGGADDGRKAESGLALVQWLSSPVEGAESCTLQALQLLSELLEEALAAGAVSECVLSFVEMALPVLLALLRGAGPPAQGDAHLRKHCHRVAHVTSLLLVLCTEDSTRALVSRQVSAPLGLQQVEVLLSCCHPAGSDNDLGQLCADALLKTLELMSKLRQQVEDMETSFYRLLQDQRIVTPLSLALTSHHRERVQTGLSLLMEATPLPDFPSLVLGESLAANNAYRQREAELSVKRVAVQEVPPPSILDGSSRSVHGLVDRMQSGFQLHDQVKDSHVSQIIDVYEQKLSAFASKESCLQDLLEAKALSLSQADRLIAQYLFERTQAEAEACQLGALLKEAERRREELHGELSGQVQEAELAKADIEELLQHNARLQHDSDQHQSLKGAYNALLNRFTDSERLLKELQASHVSLTKQSDALRRNHEALQLQHERTASGLKEREEEVRSLHSDLQQKSNDITGLHGDLRVEEQKLQLKEGERRDLEETRDALRKELNKTEQARKDASIKASSLELQKMHLEVKLKQKEDELSKHSSMIAMIHSLSSGRAKGGGDLSL
ncbi:protein CIP2A isoform X2 [Pseudoliparis swirei]|uniref:protein CIP2A isoform X2 n=1 Tax=Pseudoliparis swirei TaxID=2059687 RepID=UPI0024BD72BC|nr:protein CIP2A isoform X2 [Pseudoliparis swirei]